MGVIHLSSQSENWGVQVGATLKIANHHHPADLRAMARRERNGRVTSRMVAIAHALDGMKRVAAAELAGMDRQTLRDWVIRYNDHGIVGLADLSKRHNPEKLPHEKKAIHRDKILQTPDLAKGGVCYWRVADLYAFVITRFKSR